MPTHHCSNGVFLGRVRLLQCIVDYKVQKEVVSTQRAADLAAALKMDEEFLVHELLRVGHDQRKNVHTGIQQSSN